MSMKTINQRAFDFAIEKCCTECERNEECKDNKSAKCALALRYDVMYQKIAKEQREIDIDLACNALEKVLSKESIECFRLAMNQQKI